MNAIVDMIRRKPRTIALMVIGLAGFGGYAAFIAEDTTALWTWTPLLLCILMHGFMHGGHGHNHGSRADEPQADETPQPVPIRKHPEAE